MIKRAFSLFKKYNPDNYWKHRKNPNNSDGESKKRIEFDVKYIKSEIKQEKKILELGPGVGRTIEAYSHDTQLFTLDISEKYHDILKEKCENNEISLKQNYIKSHENFPFANNEFNVGVTSQVLLHVPPNLISHTMSELTRVCKKVVIITAYTHGVKKFFGLNHVFNHNYFNISTELGCRMDNLIMNEGRICFVLSKIEDQPK